MAIRTSKAAATGVSPRTFMRRFGRLRRAALPALAFAVLIGLAGASAAQDAAEGGSPGQAIEITADTLEVRQSENVAVFQGSVEAIQGDIVLTAETLTVHYREAGDEDGNFGVSRIHAEGDVVIFSPQETAQGQRGVYDVEEGTIELAGGVVLHQGNNIVEGAALTMDLGTGVSRIIGSGSGRVTGLFVPDDEDG